MRFRKISLAIAGATFLVSGGLAGITPAQAATPSLPATATCGHYPCSDPPGPGWEYIDTFHHLGSCIRAGDRGIYEGEWIAHECAGNGWEGYDLWVY